MKKIISMILSLTLLFCLSSTAFAAGGETITIEEYETALKEEYEKYGVEVEILDYDENIELTREMLNTALNGVTAFVNSIEISDAGTHVEIGISPFSMPVTKTVYRYWTYAYIYGSADMRTQVTGTVDAQNSHMILVSSHSTYQCGAFVNFSSWTTTSETVSLNVPSEGYVRVNVNGRITFSYADPLTGITTGYTYGVSKTFDMYFG